MTPTTKNTFHWTTLACAALAAAYTYIVPQLEGVGGYIGPVTTLVLVPLGRWAYLWMNEKP